MMKAATSPFIDLGSLSFRRFSILPQTQAFPFLSLSLGLDPEGRVPSASLRAPGSPEGDTLRAWQSLIVSVPASGRGFLHSLIQPF